MSPFSIFIFFIITTSFFLVQSINDEGIALMSFKQSINFDPFHALSGWNSSDATPCLWNGLTCDGQGRVISLFLPDKRLSGTLPPALGNLTALRRVNFRNNGLYGSLPAEIFAAVRMQSLVVSGNSFSGPVPDEIGKLSSLRTLVLSNNSFNGGVPLSLIQCRMLKVLDLSRNNFSGYLRDDFGSSLRSLEVLNLSFNELNGSIPSGLGTLLNLQGTLDLSHNHFGGLIPETIGKLPQNVYLDLSYNNLSGSIPQTDTMLNSGPTAFAGNQYLCGLPLEKPCPSTDPATNPQLPIVVPSEVAHRPSDQEQQHSRFSRGVLAAVIASAALGSCFIGFSLSYAFKKNSSCKDCKSVGVYLKKDPHSRGVITENLEEQHFVPLDSRVDFDMEKLLIASAFLLRKSRTGIVYKVVLENGQQLAVRRLNGDSQRLRDFQTEVEAVVKVRHPNIIPLQAYCWSVDEKLLIYDYMPNGDLATTIHGKGGMATLTPLSWAARLRIMKEVAKAVAYIHEFSPKKYVHGNLKLSNILLGSQMEAYVSDFGLGRLVRAAASGGSEESLSSTPLELVLSSTPEQFSSAYSSPYDQSTPIARSSSAENSMRLYYRATEASGPSQKWDVYSFGAVVIEMVTARVAEQDLVQWVQTSINERTPVSEIVDPLLLVHDLDKEKEIAAVVELGLACMDKSAERRPSMRQALNRLDKIGSI